MSTEPSNPQSPLNQHPPNRLINEKSPYLLQHAYNPVDWYPWGKEAFQAARRDNKLLLVSIGYATCHWCHVMERESFEDPELAQFLNEHFISIKVDREERPDIDKIYMDALQVIGQQGGWPLNMFITEEGFPIVGGTYFPPVPSYGRRSFRNVLELVLNLWRSQPRELLKNAQVLTQHLKKRNQLLSISDPIEWSDQVIDQCVQAYQQAYDPTWGGFQTQPQNKFPPSMGLMLLLRHYWKHADPQCLEMVRHTLSSMLQGGIYDQIGGGLCRYSTDSQWLVPHFEKMLYDNALFAEVLIETYQVSKATRWLVAAEDVLGYILRDMMTPEGAFCSAEDADSEGEEGRFYLWHPAQIKAILKPMMAKYAIDYWGITEQGNFSDPHTTTDIAQKEPHARSIAHVLEDITAVAERHQLPANDFQEIIDFARGEMLAVRSERPRPLRDDKVLACWNGLMVTAFAKMGRVSGKSYYTRVATQAMQFILDNLRSSDGRLLRRWREGEARYSGHLSDYANLALACLELYQITFELRWFDHALGLMRSVNTLFRNEKGPYYDSGVDTENLLFRTSDGYDGVEPSGNSMAALVFLMLDAYGMKEGFREDALRIFSAFKQHLQETGVGFSAMLKALNFYLAPPLEVALIGDPNAEDTQQMRHILNQYYLPNMVLAFASPEEVATTRVPLLQNRVAIDNTATVYLCHNQVCQLPITDSELLEKALKKQSPLYGNNSSETSG